MSLVDLLRDFLILEQPPNILWPPGYYIVRDRIPFFFTVLYVYRDRLLSPIVKRGIGVYMTLIVTLLTGMAIGLYLMYDDMIFLAGIHWSAPSPIEWGSFIILGVLTLNRHGIDFFEAFYMAFLAAMSGGWLYEAPNWVINGFWPMAFFKVNAVKVFFMEFQVFCLPILLYIVHTTKKYEQHRLILPLIAFAFLFYGFASELRAFLPTYIGLYGYRWVVRVPVILVLSAYLYGIKGEEELDVEG